MNFLQALGIGGLCAWRFNSQQPAAPTYEGQPLSYWLATSNNSVEAAELTAKAVEAVVNVGTNGIDFLMHEFESAKPKWFRRLLPSERLLWNIRIQQQDFNRATRAMRALELLGSKLTPYLSRIARNIDDPLLGVPTLYLLRSCESNGVRYLALGLASKDPEIVQFAVRYLGERKSEAEFAIPHIQQLTTHSDRRVRLASIIALGNIPNAAKQHLGIVSNALFDAELSVRFRGDGAASNRGNGVRGLDY